jgi:predicted amidohydrolase
LAKESARVPSDACFADLQRMCRDERVSIGIGAPLQTHGLPHISSFIFRPNAEPLVYSKRYLDPDEEAYFQPGMAAPSLIFDDPAVAMAICFEISVPQHAQQARDAGAAVYIGSVAKTARGVASARERLSQIAVESSVYVLMSNCLGFLDGAACTGSSCAWDRNGRMLVELDDSNEGVVILDCETGAAFAATLSPGT